MKKTVVVYNPIRFSNEAWLPVFWAQAKTYYERHGVKKDDWVWAPCYADIWGDDLEQVKLELERNAPDVFAISLYVWNYPIAHKIAAWVKQRWPKCLIVSGGPHQYFKHDDAWFKKHDYIDASLPGECYGELAIQQILDQVDDHGRVDWNQVTDIYYPAGRGRRVTAGKNFSTVKEKRNFDYQWSAIDAQLPLLEDFINYHRSHFKNSKVMSIIETTRGCPYGCTYCDWGGGINAKVLAKDFEQVRLDIDALCKLDLHYLYFADANFGIFGDRDVDIIEYIAQQRKNNLQTFNLGYGGFAKTANKLEYIKKILQTDIKHQLSVMGEIKISMQSLDDEVLRKIDRKNIPLDQQIAALKDASPWKKLPIYVELIHGLPGMTTDKFYHELDILGNQRLSIQWYPWILLPEAPAYSRSYRDQHGIGVTVRTQGGWNWSEDVNSYNEIVIESNSFTRDDYLEMMLSSGLYKLFVQGGLYQDTIRWIEQHHQVGIGEICKDVYQNFFMGSSVTEQFKQQVHHQWHNVILKNSTVPCFINIPDTDEEYYLGLFFIGLAYQHHNEFTVPLGAWLQQQWAVPDRLILQDQSLIIHKDNFGTKKLAGIVVTDYTKKLFKFSDNLNKVMLQFVQFKNSGHILRARKKLFGLF